MPSKIDDYWREQVRQRTQAADDGGERLGPGPLRARLEAFGKADGRRDHPPSERWIAGEQAAFRQMDDAARGQYSELRWPQSFEHGALPWEAAPSAVEMLRHCEYARRPRPLVRAAQWFWRVTQVAPDAPTAWRFSAAWAMVAYSLSRGSSDVPGAVEGALILRAWDDEDYNQAQTLLGKPLISLPLDPMGMEAAARFMDRRRKDRTHGKA